MGRLFPNPIPEVLMSHPLRSLPKIDKILQESRFSDHSKELLATLARDYLKEIRTQFLQEAIPIPPSELILQEIERRYETSLAPSLVPLVNATGIIVHTNLGRSVFAPELIEEIKPLLTSYNNLEYDLKEGRRGERYSHLHGILKAILGCEEVLVVNNNAAAVFLILHTFAQNQEAIISRGELIEIGGSFRIPEVMKNAGAILKEVGTTNKTHRRDYEEAITPQSALLMKVHKSNYDIVGFTQEVELQELIDLAKKHDLIDYYDLGSGFLESVPFTNEPTLKKIASLSPSLVSFSGDKLLGGAQAGIIFGKKSLIDRLKKNQLLRMLRVDKFTLAALEATLRAHLLHDYEKIPTLKMAHLSLEELKERAKKLKSCVHGYESQILQTQGYAGGGALPNQSFFSIALALCHPQKSPMELEQSLRARGVIARIEQERVLLDMRTIFTSQLESLAQILNEVF